MSTAILQRVTHLIRLSTSDNEHEARSAALAACRLIVSEGLVVSERSVVVRSPLATASSDLGQKTASTAEEILRRAGIRLTVRPSAGGTPLTQKNRPRPVVMANPSTTPTQIKAKFGGRCEDCHAPYAQGDMVWYRRGVGCVHAGCQPEALV